MMSLQTFLGHMPSDSGPGEIQFWTIIQGGLTWCIRKNQQDLDVQVPPTYECTY